MAATKVYLLTARGRTAINLKDLSEEKYEFERN